MIPAVNRQDAMHPGIAAAPMIGITTPPTPQQVVQQAAQAVGPPIVA